MTTTLENRQPYLGNHGAKLSEAAPASPPWSTQGDLGAAGEAVLPARAAGGSVAGAGFLVLARDFSAPKLDVRGALRAFGLDDESTFLPATRIHERTWHGLWSRMDGEPGAPSLGLRLGEKATADTYGILGHMVTRASTLREGLELFARYARIAGDGDGFAVTFARQDLSVVFGGAGRRAPPALLEDLLVASFLTLVHRALGTPLRARAVRLRADARRRSPEHARVLGVTPTFGASQTELVLDGGVAAARLPDANAQLLGFLRGHADELLARLPRDDDFQRRVEQELSRALELGPPGIDRIASRLWMSGRTLQRRLAMLGQSFRSVVSSVRRARAEQLLADPRLSVAEVAREVGFSEPASFHRAFRRWTGLTPTEHRRRCAEDARAARLEAAASSIAACSLLGFL